MNTTQRLNLLLAKFNQLDRALLQQEGERKALLSVQDQLSAQLTQERNKIILYEKVGVVVQKLTEISRRDTLDKVASIVSVALQEIKDPTLTFKINYKVERNQAIAEFLIHDSKLQRDMDPLQSCGGTLIDLIELPLKVSLLLKWSPQLAKVLILDESFKFVSTADRPKLASFIRQLAENLGLQIILITHSPEVASTAHQVFKVVHDGTQSKVVNQLNDQPEPMYL